MESRSLGEAPATVRVVPTDGFWIVQVEGVVIGRYATKARAVDQGVAIAIYREPATLTILRPDGSPEEQRSFPVWLPPARLKTVE